MAASKLGEQIERIGKRNSALAESENIKPGAAFYAAHCAGTENG